MLVPNIHKLSLIRTRDIHCTHYRRKNKTTTKRYIIPTSTAIEDKYCR